MPIVSIRATSYVLPDGANTIDDVYAGLTHNLLALTQATNVKNEGDHVACVVGGVVFSVKFLYNSGRQYWQVIATAEEADAANADAEIAEMQTLIRSLYARQR